MFARAALVAAAVLMLCGTCFAGPELSLGLKKDRQALLELRAAVTPGGFGNSRLQSWKSTGHPCIPKPWAHISCSATGNGVRVTGINLSNLKIQATLPKSLRTLNALTTLNLEGNKFTGPIPAVWADAQFFQKLTTLSLRDNQLSGGLPNRKWNRAGAFASLVSLDLSQNRLEGGLPDGWLSTARTFRKLKYLDLSDNFLAYRVGSLGNSDSLMTFADPGDDLDGASAVSEAQPWCWVGVATTTESGWCPTNSPVTGTMAALEILDLSNNGLAGPIIDLKWPIMFPKLMYLYLAENNLHTGVTGGTAEDESLPLALPSDWTKASIPRAFPQLAALVLWPGNDNICFLPDWENNGVGYLEVNKDNTYDVVDTELEAYDSSFPFPCPGATADNEPTGVTATTVADASTDTLLVTWVPDSTPAYTPYGYKVTVYVEDPDTREYDLVDGWNGKLIRTYTDADFTAADDVDPDLTFADPVVDYVLDTQFTGISGLNYKVGVTAFNMDGVSSSFTLSAAYEWPAPAPTP